LAELLQIVTPAQSLNATLGIHNTLLTSVKGMTFAANFYAHRRLSSTSVENVTAGTSHHRVVKLRMNVGFHNLKRRYQSFMVSIYSKS
jgi:hypothetical protein